MLRHPVATISPTLAARVALRPRNCFAMFPKFASLLYQCYVKHGPNSNYGAAKTIWNITQGVSVVSQHATCCDPPTSSCHFPLTGTGEGLVDVDASGATQSACDTTNTAAITSDTFCPVYCLDCAGGRNTSDDTSVNLIFTFSSCGNDGYTAQSR